MSKGLASNWTPARRAAVVAAALAFLVPVIGGFLAPGYSHAVHFISELGARGSTLGALVSYAGFLPIGLAALAALVLVFRDDSSRGLRTSIVWMFTLPFSYLTAAFARCAAGCAGVDTAQVLHNLAGVAEYLGGAIALAMGGAALLRMRRFAWGVIAWLTSMGVLGCFLAMAAPGWTGYHGAVQRLAEAALFGFVLFLAWQGRQPVRATLA